MGVRPPTTTTFRSPLMVGCSTPPPRSSPTSTRPTSDELRQSRVAEQSFDPGRILQALDEHEGERRVR